MLRRLEVSSERNISFRGRFDFSKTIEKQFTPNCHCLAPADSLWFLSSLNLNVIFSGRCLHTTGSWVRPDVKENMF